MNRTDFIKKGIGYLGMALVAPSLLKAQQNAATCSVTSSETEGPFPTKIPTNYVRSNIIGDRTGVPFVINITVKNTNDNCGVLQGALVDIWHCDKDGYYSEYGGTTMQTVDFTSNHFLRGRQITDANGLVSFTSIFPGWYMSRATHIHVHIYDSTGKSLLVTQIAFPEATDSAVAQVNSATALGYTKGMTGYTYNASDNVFSDSVSNEMSTITGSVANGFILTHTINVSGATTTGINDEDAQSQFKIGQNYPNPFSDETTIPVFLRQTSDVKIELYNMLGKKITEANYPSLGIGEQQLKLSDFHGLLTGNYVCNIQVSNGHGIFKQVNIITKK